jgi:hypothetical protein
MSCGAPAQSAEVPAGVNTVDQAILQGKVLAGGTPVQGAFVRLLDATGEFTAEVVSSPTGDFRFYAAPGSWTVRALSRVGSGQAEIHAAETGVHSIDVVLA